MNEWIQHRIADAWDLPIYWSGLYADVVSNVARSVGCDRLADAARLYALATRVTP